jgi:D-alanine-D-alanine ligase
MSAIMIGVDYRGGTTFGGDYGYACSLYDILIDEGLTASLYNINDPLDATWARWPETLCFVLEDTFAPGSPNAARHPGKHTLRQALENANRPFIGSSFETFSRSSSANKIAARQYLAASVRIPDGAVVTPGDDLPRGVHSLIGQLGLPVVVKQPFDTGASVGVAYVETEAELREALSGYLVTTGRPVLVEQYIDGSELTVWIVDVDGRPSVYGSVEILKPDGEPILTQYGKNLAQAVPGIEAILPGVPRYQIPPGLPATALEAAERAALQAHQALGLRHYSRVDLIVHDGVPFVLEVNARPQLREGGIGAVAAARGAEFGTVVVQLVEEVYHQVTLAKATAP